MQENNLVVSYKTEHAPTTQPSNCILGHLSQGNENLGSHKILLWIFIEALFITAKIRGVSGTSFNRWMVK